MCNLFRASLYFEEDILNQNLYRGRTTATNIYILFFKSDVTDIPLLIRKYCIIKRQESNRYSFIN